MWEKTFVDAGGLVGGDLFAGKKGGTAQLSAAEVEECR